MNSPQAVSTTGQTHRKAVTRASELADRNIAALACFVLHAGLLAGCAKVGALRLPDLAVTLLVVGVSYTMALRDHPKLPVLHLIVWVFAPLLRRLVDWSSGGFVSLTAISILPLMTTLTLVIPTYPRWSSIPRRVREPWMYVLAPVCFATVLGVATHGVAAGPMALKWVVPMLFVPYFASRPNRTESIRVVSRTLVVCAGVSGLYAIYQFFVLPAWDRMWLIESGMTSSMGKPYPMQLRAWGTMNSCGPAAQVWALAIVVAMLDTRWKSLAKKGLLALCVMAMLLSLVRSAWVMLCVGVMAMAIQSGGKRAGTAIAAGVLVVAAILVAATLPGGERIMNRLETFENLSADRSVRARNNIADDLTEQLLENPLGRGMGFASAAKISGAAEKTEAIDNGLGQLALTISVPGALLWCFGTFTLGTVAFGYGKSRRGTASETARMAVVAMSMSGVAMLAGFTFIGLVGAVTWCLLGIGVARLPDLQAIHRPPVYPSQSPAN